MSEFGLFDIINNIFEKKGQLTPDELKAYAPFIVNKALSQHKDLIHLANALNRLNSVDKEMHYTFLYHGVPKKKRFGKWHKNTDDSEKISLIQDYYGYSYHRAKEVLPLLVDQLSEIKQSLSHGGSRGGKNK